MCKRPLPRRPRPQQRHALTSADAQSNTEKRRRDQDDGKRTDERKHSLLTGLDHPAKPLIQEIFTICGRQ